MEEYVYFLIEYLNNEFLGVQKQSISNWSGTHLLGSNLSENSPFQNGFWSALSFLKVLIDKSDNPLKEKLSPSSYYTTLHNRYMDDTMTVNCRISMVK